MSGGTFRGHLCQKSMDGNGVSPLTYGPFRPVDSRWNSRLGLVKCSKMAKWLQMASNCPPRQNMSMETLKRETNPLWTGISGPEHHAAHCFALLSLLPWQGQSFASRQGSPALPDIGRMRLLEDNGRKPISPNLHNPWWISKWRTDCSKPTHVYACVIQWVNVTAAFSTSGASSALILSSSSSWWQAWKCESKACDAHPHRVYIQILPKSCQFFAVKLCLGAFS